MECKKIGKINRFGEIKTYTCIEYLGSDHQKEFNSEFNKDYFCGLCSLSIMVKPLDPDAR